ncbi:MAG: sigma-54-dependent Fis family transcriptional regulator [Treponema sp.]|nr:sigma-54-dependent Fis family transcriptional regulator [Treponema sp.]
MTALFSESADDVAFTRRNSDFIIRYASDLESFRRISEKFIIQDVFVRSSCISDQFMQLMEEKHCKIHKFSVTAELERLIEIERAKKNKTCDENFPSGGVDYDFLCEKSPKFASLVGKSPAMERLRQTIIKLASLDVSILLLGETGTGKTSVARAIHELSERRKRPFKEVVIANMNESLVEAKLFGVASGGFTGAVPGKGLFEDCDGGTLFFDEIGEVSLNIQTKLLQVLGEGMINRIGSNKDIPVDNRMIFATNANLEAKIRQGTFREDLFYRINDVTLRIPPLRERLEDIPELAEAYLRREKINKNISDSALAALQTFSWKGNIRQLEKVLKNAALLYCDGDTIGAKDIRL